MLLVLRLPLKKKRFTLDGGKSLVLRPAVILRFALSNDRALKLLHAAAERGKLAAKVDENRQKREDARNPHQAIFATTYDMTGNMHDAAMLTSSIENKRQITDINSGKAYKTSPLNLAYKMHDLFELAGRPRITHLAGITNTILQDEAEDKRANYMPINNTVYGANDAYDVMDELAHGILFKNKDILNSGQFLRFLTGLVAPDSNNSDNYESRYHIPGNIENEAHHVIEPHMYDYIEGTVDKLQLINNIRNSLLQAHEETPLSKGLYNAAVERGKQISEKVASRLNNRSDLFNQRIGSSTLGFKKGGLIKEKNKGKFTKSAKAAGESVLEHARKVLASPNATLLLKKRAQFAVNSKKWHK